MNKGDFAVALAERCELSKADGGRALDAILDTLTEAVAEHDEVALTGWGKFSAQRRKGRDAHDPRDPSKTIHIAPTYVAKFKAGTVLKREIQSAFADRDEESSTTAGEARAASTSEARADGKDRQRDRRETGGQALRPGAWRPLARR